MLVSQFASGRQQLPFSLSHLIVENGGTTTISRTLYFSLQGENQSGLNLLAPMLGPITIPTGKRLRIQIPDGFAKTGEKFFRYVISASETTDPLEMAQLAAIDLYSLASGVLSKVPFPLSITLQTDEDFALKKSVNNIGQLPVNPVNGMCRRLNDLAAIYEFNKQVIWRNNTDFITTNPNGTWVRTGLFSTFVEQTTSDDGCDRPLDRLNENIKRPVYQLDNSDSVPTTFWLMNRGTDPILSGERIGLSIEAGGEDISDIASTTGILHFQLDGYITNTGELDTSGTNGIGSMPGAGFVRVYQNKKTNLRLPKPLPSGQAMALTVWLNANAVRTGGVISLGSRIKVAPKIFKQAGSYEGAGLFFGDLIAPSENPADGMGRVYPSIGLSVRVMQRSGCVDSYFFLDIPESTITGLALNTAGQYIGINGNGDTYAIPNNTIAASEAVRAIVGTVNGISNVGSSSDVTVAANSAINLTCNYPYDSSLELAKIRADYPDVIANEYAYFNPLNVIFYVKNLLTNQIRKFSEPLLPNVSQTFTLDNWSTSEIVVQLPTASNSFGLFAPPTPTNLFSTVNAGDFPAQSYRIWVAFEYQSTVTSISHSEYLGCIEEAPVRIANLFALYKSWGDAIAFNQIRLIPQNKTFPGQTRRVWTTGDEIYFDVSSFSVDDNLTVFRPNWCLETQPGRWILKPSVALTPEQIRDKLKLVDGAGSGVDADLFDGKNSSEFATSDHVHNIATTSAAGFMSATDKSKLNGLDSANFAASDHSHSVATPSAAGFMSATDKSKLNGLDSANFAASDHSHAVATTSAAGFMSATDKSKLDNLGIGSSYAASDHSHAVATSSATGFMSSADKVNLAAIASTSISAKLFWASPLNASGLPSFRGLDKLDMPTAVPLLDTSNTYLQAQRSAMKSLSINTSNGTVTLNASDSNDYLLELSQNATLIITNAVASDSFRLTLIQPSVGGKILTFPTGTLWQAGSPPTFSSTPGAISKFYGDTHNGLIWTFSYANYS